MSTQDNASSLCDLPGISAGNNDIEDLMHQCLNDISADSVEYVPPAPTASDPTQVHAVLDTLAVPAVPSVGGESNCNEKELRATTVMTLPALSTRPKTTVNSAQKRGREDDERAFVKMRKGQDGKGVELMIRFRLSTDDADGSLHMWYPNDNTTKREGKAREN
ncbi:hypothetical protein FGB62_215g00 [Gracilaria domingensis]|nr:hypothetical protein FGB62_215g00 [Gracilaria domingensis]